MDQPVLILITAADCPVCVSLKEKWPPIAQKLRKYAQIVEIPLTSVGSRVSEPFPIDLNNHIRWFPFIVVIPSQVWYESVKNPSKTKLSGVRVYGADWRNNRWEAKNVPYDEEHILAWLQSVTLPAASSMGARAPSTQPQPARMISPPAAKTSGEGGSYVPTVCSLIKYRSERL